MTFEQVSKLSDNEARTYMEHMRWPNGPECVHCGSSNVVSLEGNSTRPGVKKCRDCRKQFTVTVGTIFERSHIPLRKWLIALAMICASKKGISALQLMRQLDLGSYKTAWHMAHRIREAMDSGPLYELLSGPVEADDTYIGGKPRKGGPRRYRKRGRGTEKPAVLALIEREGRVHAQVMERVDGRNLKRAIDQVVDKQSALLTDQYGAYRKLGKEFEGGHHTVNHSKGEYSRDGWIHVNNCESYFALLKRGINGAFHHVSKQHLRRYCHEFEFRWNTRKLTDSQRFETALKACPGKRLQYKD